MPPTLWGRRPSLRASLSKRMRSFPTPVAGLALGIASLGLAWENVLPGTRIAESGRGAAHTLDRALHPVSGNAGARSRQPGGGGSSAHVCDGLDARLVERVASQSPGMGIALAVCAGRACGFHVGV